MLDVQMLKAMPQGCMFAVGSAMDNEEGLFMANTGEMLTWVAIRGGGLQDWAVYCHLQGTEINYIKTNGDKVSGKRNIKLCVPCDDEAYKTYRR